MKKKLINLSKDALEKVEIYSQKWELNYSETIRKIIQEFDNSEKVEIYSDDSEFVGLIEKVNSLEKNYSYFQADETQSKVGNSELLINNLQKSIKELEEKIEKFSDLENKINVLTSISKLFKKHLDNREIHLQD